MESPSNLQKTTQSGRYTYRYAVGLAFIAALLLVWLSLGVGIIGRDGDPANLMYFGVIAVGLIGGNVRFSSLTRSTISVSCCAASVTVMN